jgi:tRNA (adenine22-N1)-methyltransferase
MRRKKGDLFMPDHGSLSVRLGTALTYIQAGERVADIGTDHAYLPIHLIREGIASRALAADINEGPLESARLNVREAGLEGKIDLLLTDGLHGVRDWHPDRILIFGMGGELIAKILSEADWVRDPAIGLVLQPMSRAAFLRRWLQENGFAITGETLSFEDRFYQTLSVRWTEEKIESYSEGELLLGRENLRARSPLFLEFVRHERAVMQRILDGKKRARSVDCSEELRLMEFMDSLLEGEREE